MCNWSERSRAAKIGWGSIVAVLLGLGGLSGYSPAYAQTPEEWRERFLREAPKAWEDYLAFARTLQGRWTSRMTFPNYSSVTHYQIKQNRHCRLSAYEVEHRQAKYQHPRELYGEVHVINSQYAFQLGRRKPQASWFVAEIIVNGDKSKIIERIDRSIAISSGRLVSLFYTDLRTLIKQATFRIMDIKPISYNGRECVELHFDNTHEVGIKGKLFVPEQRGKLILDPNRFWTLCSAEIVSIYLSDQDKYKEYPENISIVTRDSKSGFPIIIKYTYKILEPTVDKILESTIENEYELDEVKRLPRDEEFTLSAFGLPEPVGLERPVRWWLWAGVAGVLLMVVGAVFFRLAHRRRQAE
jgi:hypothetical protein